MKRILLGTTAVLSAGLLSTAAPGAAGAAEVSPGGPLDVIITGFSRFRAHGGDLDNARLDPSYSTGLDFSNDTEVHVLARGKDETTGIEYGATVEFEADTNQTNNTDETWIFMRGGFGEVRFGDEDGATDNSRVSAATIAAGTGGIDGSVIDTIAISPLGLTNSGDETKARYYTPTFGGFSLGVSYTPNVDGGGDTLAPTDVPLGDWWEGALVYEGDLGGVGLLASVVGDVCDVKDGNAPGDSCWGYQAGASLEIFGFSLAGSFADEDIAGVEKTLFNVGVGAGLGPANFSVTYGQITHSKNYVGADGREPDKPYNLVFSADVGLMPGVVLAGDLGLFDNDAGGSDDGYQAVARLGIAY